MTLDETNWDRDPWWDPGQSRAKFGADVFCNSQLKTPTYIPPTYIPPTFGQLRDYGR